MRALLTQNGPKAIATIEKYMEASRACVRLMCWFLTGLLIELRHGVVLVKNTCYMGPRYSVASPSVL